MEQQVKRTQPIDSAEEGSSTRLAAREDLTGKHIWCYDGQCGFCDGNVKFFMRFDKQGDIRYTHLQSEFAQRELKRLSADARELEAGLEDSANFRTFYMIADYGTENERLYSRSRGMRFAWISLGGVFAGLGWMLWWVPSPLVDWLYILFSRIRYKLKGRHEACIMPSPEQRALFVG